MFLPDSQTMKFVRSLTTDPSENNIRKIVNEISTLLPPDESLEAQLELIAMAVKPVHPGITDRLRNMIDS